MVAVATSIDGDILFNHNALGGEEVWLLTIDSIGSIISSSTFGGSGFDNPFGAINANNDLVIVGTTESNNNGDVSNYHFSPVYPYDGWVLRINNFTTNINALNPTELQFFPNPTCDKINFLNFPTEISSPIAIRIYDLYGNLIFTKNTFVNSDGIDISTLRAGCYILSVILNNNESYVFKLIKL